MTEPEAAYRQAERQLRELLFGDGETMPGVVKGEERRLLALQILRRMKHAFDDAADQGTKAGVAPLDVDLRRELKEARDRADRDM